MSPPIIGANENCIDVHLRFDANTGAVGVQSTAPPAVVYDVLLATLRGLFVTAVKQLEQRPDILIPSIVPGGGHRL